MGAADPIIGLPLFGGYKIIRKIGAGGMGAVYLVENRSLGKKLAVKVLLTDRSVSPQTTARFLAEARAASAIQHKNIIDILDCSELPDGRHYILMEFLDGMTLRRYAKRKGPLSIEKLLSIMVQVCSGLDAAHTRGIIHRDLKPSNIFVAPTKENPLFTKVLDFGIAKLEDPLLAGEVKTRSQAVAGTPHYMSPEQARALRDVDHRADVYSVGAIIYELLTGKLPYHAHSIGELVFQQTRTKPIPPIEIKPDIPPEWSELVMRAIDSELERRTVSVSQLAHELIEATPKGRRYAKFQAPLLYERLNSPNKRAGSFIPVVETKMTYISDLDNGTGTRSPSEGAPTTTLDVPPPMRQHTAHVTEEQIESEAEQTFDQKDDSLADGLEKQAASSTNRGYSRDHSEVDLEELVAQVTAPPADIPLRPPATRDSASPDPTVFTNAESRRFGAVFMFVLTALVAAGLVILWHRSGQTQNGEANANPTAGSFDAAPAQPSVELDAGAPVDAAEEDNSETAPVSERRKTTTKPTKPQEKVADKEQPTSETKTQAAKNGQGDTDSRKKPTDAPKLPVKDESKTGSRPANTDKDTVEPELIDNEGAPLDDAVIDSMPSTDEAPN